jgi:hypothetical protein
MKRSRTVVVSSLGVAAAGWLAGCGDDDQTAYCTNQQGDIVDNSNCDRSSGFGGGFFFIGGLAGGRLGGRVPSPDLSSRTDAGDRARVNQRFGGFGSTASGGVGRKATGGSFGRSGGGGFGGFSGGS